MLSALSQGYGTWQGLTNITEPETLPSVDLSNEHKHGVTVKSARRQKPRIVTVEQVDGCIHIPKTYLTRKGALVLYSSEKEIAKDKESHKPIDVEKVIQRLGNVRRLMASVLYLNDSQVADPDISVSDERNEVFMGFLKTVDSVLYKQRIQPGRDLNFYLNSLRMRARKIANVAGTDIAQQINALLCTPAASSRPSTSGTMATRKLSSAKLTASLKSDSYMGRKILYPVLDTSMHDPSGTDTPFSTLTLPNDPHQVSNDQPKASNRKTAGSTQRIHSAGHVSDAPNFASRSLNEADAVSAKLRASSAVSTASGSLVEDLTLFEEVDISLPSETGGPEPDSDLENEYFKSVLNIDELPRPRIPDASAKSDREAFVNSSIDRHLTNTPDIESTVIDIEVKESVPMTPEITLRSGNNDTFNIFKSHVSDDDLTVKPQRSQRRSLSHSSRDRKSDSSRKASSSHNFTTDHQSDSNLQTCDDAEAQAQDTDWNSQLEGAQSKRSFSSSAHSLRSASEPGDENNIQVNVKFAANKELPRLVQQSGTGLLSADERTSSAPQSTSASATSHVTDQTRPHSGTTKRESTHSAQSRATSVADDSRKASSHKSVASGGKDSLQLPAILGIGTDQRPSSHSSAASRISSAKASDLENSFSKVDPFIAVKHIATEDNNKKAKPDIVYRLPSTGEGTSHQPKVSKAPKTSKVRDADKEALKRAEQMRLSDQQALEALMKEPDEVKEMMASNLLEGFDESGLSLEEMELAREILNQKKTEAEKGIEKSLSTRVEGGDKKTKVKTAKAFQQVAKDASRAKRKELMEKKEEVRQSKRLEQQRRTAEKKALQEMILIKSKEEQAFLAEEQRRINEIMERERYMNAVAEEARQQEEEARRALAESRRQAKLERERKRKEDLERRKEEAIRRREEQKRLQDSARQKELDMLEKISDAETVRNLREKERKRREEEEWKLQAKLMEEERMSSLRAEDEEARMANIEREAEEDAMARLVEERMEAERKEREIEQQRRLLQEREDEQRAYMEREKQGIEDELRQKEEEERRELEAERQRILELQRLEIEAQEQMQREIEERRAELMRLRELNMDKKRNLEAIKKNQAYNKPWVFSYYVKWERESYERLMGGGSADKRRRPTPRKKTS